MEDETRFRPTCGAKCDNPVFNKDFQLGEKVKCKSIKMSCMLSDTAQRSFYWPIFYLIESVVASQ